MTMQHNIDIVRRSFRRNMHEPKLQTLAGKIDHQRPVLVPIAISANHGKGRPDCLQVQSDRRFADIAQMPDFVGFARKIENLLRQFVMSVCDYENPKHRISKESENAGRERSFSNLFSWFPAFLRDNWSISCEVLI